MTRRLLAFLALLTGLAALSGAATVSYAHANSTCDASVSAIVEDASANPQAGQHVPENVAPAADEASAIERKAPVPESLRLPVLMGIDRAYE